VHQIAKLCILRVGLVCTLLCSSAVDRRILNMAVDQIFYRSTQTSVWSPSVVDGTDTANSFWYRLNRLCGEMNRIE